MKVFFAIAACLMLSAGLAGAEWYENFDSYTSGSLIIGQGGWAGWDNNPAWNALVSSDQAQSAPNSVAITPTSDIVQQFDNFTSGLWTISAYCYIPTGSAGHQYFILLNTYNHGGPYNWSVQLRFNSTTGMMNVMEGSGSAPIVNDQWTKVEFHISLDDNLQTIYYNGIQLDTIPWTSSGAMKIGAIDLYSDMGSTIYWDDLSIEPGAALTPGTWGQIKASW